MTATEVDHAPARLSAALAVVAASVVAAVALPAGGPAQVVGPVGVLGVALGVVRGSRRAVTLGSAALLLAVLAAGLAGGDVELLLAGAMATVLAWDVGEQAINVGEQLGRAADTTRLEVVHAAASLAVAALAAGIGYGVFRSATGGQPVTALVFLLLGGVVLTSALRT